MAQATRDLLPTLPPEIGRGAAVAVVGAGLSAEVGLPRSSELLRAVNSELAKLGSAGNHETLAAAVQELDDRTNDRRKVRRFLRDQILDAKCRERHHPWCCEIWRKFKYVLTTNWDCLLERICLSRMSDLPCSIIPFVFPDLRQAGGAPGYSAGTIDLTSGEHYLIKLHGTITRPDSMAASTGDINQLETVTTGSSSFAQSLRSILASNRVFFIGHSMQDRDLLIPYLQVLPHKSQPDYFLYRRWGTAEATADILNWMRKFGGNIEPLQCEVPSFFDALRSVSVPWQPKLGGEPPAQTQWGRPTVRPTVVGHPAVGDVERFLADGERSLCVVSSTPHAGSSTVASYVLDKASSIVGPHRVCWIEFKDYLPFPIYRTFIEDYLRSRGIPTGTALNVLWPSPGYTPEEAGDEIGKILLEMGERTVFVLEQFHQCAGQRDVAAFFGHIVRATSEENAAGQAQFVAFVPHQAGLPGVFDFTLGEGHRTSQTLDVTLAQVPPDALLAMLEERLSYQRREECEKLVRSFAKPLPVGVAVLATVLLVRFDYTWKRVRQLLRGPTAAECHDTLLEKITSHIKDEKPALYDFMLRCSVFRTPRDRRALHTIRGSGRRDPIALANDLLDYGILARGRASEGDEPTYAMPSSIRRFLARQEEAKRNSPNLNRIAARHYLDEAKALPEPSSHEAMELLAAAFYHSQQAQDFRGLIEALKDRGREVVGGWNLPVIRHWLEHISGRYKWPKLTP